MTAICGVIGGDRGNTERLVRRMFRCMQHRGRDVEEMLSPAKDPEVPPIVLGFSDREGEGESLSRQGFFGQGNEFIVVDGQVSNIRTLRHRLAAEGSSFQTTRDAEVILRAIASWGPQAIGELEGCFALAYFNRFTNSLLLARDKTGINPLYYAQVPGLLVFASEVRAILATGVVPEDIDFVGLATCLAYGRLLGSRTMHAAVRSLPAASYRIVKAIPSGIAFQEPVRYWTPPPHTSAQQSGEDVLLSIHNVLEKVLTAENVAAVRPCVLLSDGLASAYLAATTNAFAPGTASFTVGVDSVVDTGTLQESDSAFAFGHYKREQVTDAIRDAAASAIALGLSHHQVVTDREWVAAQVPEWLRLMDQPTVGGLNKSILINAAMERGFRVQLSGMGAAEMLGYSRAYGLVPRIRSLLSGSRWLPRRWRMDKLAGLFKNNHEELVDAVLLGGEGTPFQQTMRLHRVFGNEALASLGLAPQQLELDADLFGEELQAADAVAGDDVVRGIMGAESAWAHVKRRELSAWSDICAADVRAPFLEPAYQEAISRISGAAFTSLTARHGSPLQGLAATTLPLEIVRRPRSEWSLQRHAWRYYSSSKSYDKHVEALAESGVVPSAALRKLWREARLRSDPRQAVILAAIGCYLAELPKTIATARHAAG